VEKVKDALNPLNIINQIDNNFVLFMNFLFLKYIYKNIKCAVCPLNGITTYAFAL